MIWQYGKRGEVNQTVLSVGGTQVESNYRLRVISNASSLSSISDDDPFDSEPARSRITVNNLEIRRLQLSDSGWYECQLPTKPTQINYIHLEVLGIIAFLELTYLPKNDPKTEKYYIFGYFFLILNI